MGRVIFAFFLMAGTILLYYTYEWVEWLFIRLHMVRDVYLVNFSFLSIFSSLFALGLGIVLHHLSLLTIPSVHIPKFRTEFSSDTLLVLFVMVLGVMLIYLLWGASTLPTNVLNTSSVPLFILGILVAILPFVRHSRLVAILISIWAVGAFFHLTLYWPIILVSPIFWIFAGSSHFRMLRLVAAILVGTGLAYLFLHLAGLKLDENLRKFGSITINQVKSVRMLEDIVFLVFLWISSMSIVVADKVSTPQTSISTEIVSVVFIFLASLTLVPNPIYIFSAKFAGLLILAALFSYRQHLSFSPTLLVSISMMLLVIFSLYQNNMDVMTLYFFEIMCLVGIIVNFYQKIGDKK